VGVPIAEARLSIPELGCRGQTPRLWRADRQTLAAP